MTMRLAVRTPFAGRALLDFLASRGRRHRGGGRRWYARTLACHTAPARSARADDSTAPAQTAFVRSTFMLSDLRDAAAAVERARRLVDADCDPVAVDDALRSATR